MAFNVKDEANPVMSVLNLKQGESKERVFSPHKHATKTWENAALTFHDHRCYLAAFFALLGGSIETVTTNPIQPLIYF